MVLDPSANFIRQSLGSSVGTNDPETIDVSDASEFPDPANGQYNLVLWDTDKGRPDEDVNAEIVRVTGRDTGADTLTVARAQEGTSNLTHPSTSAVQLAHTAKLRDDTDSAVGSVGSFSGTPPTIDEVTAPVGSDTVNGVRIAEPGEVQTVIDNAASDTNVGIGYDKARAKVKLKPETVYDEGAEIVVKPGVDLDLNGANIGNTVNGGDHNILFLDTGANLVGNGRIGIDSSVFTSDAIVLDSDRSTYGRYSLGQSGSAAGTQAQMRNGHVEIRGDGTNTPGGTAIAFRGSAPVTIGSSFNATIFWMENGVYADQNTTFTNFDPSDFTILGCTNHIRQGPNSNQFKTPLRVSQQPTAPTDRMMYNESAEPMPVTTGAHWDPSNCSVNALVGPGINLRQKILTNADWTANSDGNLQQFIHQPGANAAAGYERFEHPGTGGEWGIDPRGGNYEIVDESNNYDALQLQSGGGSAVFGGRLEVGGGTGSSFPNLTLPSGGGIYEASDGDPEAVDDAGNTTTIGSL